MDFTGGRSGGLVFPSLEEFSTVCCDPHSQRLWCSPFLYHCFFNNLCLNLDHSLQPWIVGSHSKSLLLFKNLFIYLWLHSVFAAVHGLSPVVVGGLFDCSDFSCCGAWAQGCVGSVVAICGLSCPHRMWNLPRPGIKHMSLGLVGHFSTAKPLSQSPFYDHF